MGGLRKFMPVTFATYAVGMMALAGVPCFSRAFGARTKSCTRCVLASRHVRRFIWGDYGVPDRILHDPSDLVCILRRSGTPRGHTASDIGGT